MQFSKAHTFFLSAEAVQGAQIAQITAIDLYFKFKPRATNNKSGINNPGASLIICGTDLNNAPLFNPSQTYEIARLEYDQIIATSDAALPSRFVFPTPVPLVTNRSYAFLIRFDGNEDFVLWTSKTGDPLVGTSSQSPGSSGGYVGNLFEFIPTDSVISIPSSSGDQMVTSAGSTPISSLWRPKADTFLKFKIYAARYFTSGVPISNTDTNVVFEGGVFKIPIPFQPMDYFTFDISKSNFGNRIVGGAKVYQNTAFHPGGWANGSSHITVSVSTGNTIVVANTRYPNGQLFNWNNIYDQGSDPEYIVITSQSHSGGLDSVAVRRIDEILSNTQIRLSEAVHFSNNSAKFFKSPVGTIRRSDSKKLRGVNQGILVVSDSNANDSVNFVSGAVANVVIAVGGSGYHNSEVIYVFGFEEDNDKFEGGYLAVANLVTNSSGGITAVHFSNVGAYFMNSASIGYVIANSSTGFTGSNTANGSSADLTLTFGTVLKAETFTQNQFFKDCEVYNQAISTVTPQISIISPTGTTYKLINQSLFERVATGNLVEGYFDRPRTTIQRDLVEQGVGGIFQRSSNATNISRSKQYASFYANGNAYVPVRVGGTTVNNALLLVEGSANNDFTSLTVGANPTLFYSSFMINNDYTGENTDDGNAWSKYVSSKLNFKEDRFAEDLIVDIVAHRPVGTDIQVFGRLHNSLDTEDEFNDKDWTRLEMIEGNGVFSDLTNSNDLKEFRFSVPQSPNTDFTLDGTVTVSTGNNQVVGVGTAFNTNLVAGDLVKISQPLFPESHFIAIVNTVVGATAINLDFTTANASVLGSGMKIERIRSFKKQAFKNHQNDNVATYFAENGGMFDRFDTFAIKIVLLSDNPAVVPSIEHVRGVGTSA
jgi:hypothetical protein